MEACCSSVIQPMFTKQPGLWENHIREHSSREGGDGVSGRREEGPQAGELQGGVGVSVSQFPPK